MCNPIKWPCHNILPEYIKKKSAVGCRSKCGLLTTFCYDLQIWSKCRHRLGVDEKEKGIYCKGCEKWRREAAGWRRRWWGMAWGMAGVTGRVDEWEGTAFLAGYCCWMTAGGQVGEHGRGAQGWAGRSQGINHEVAHTVVHIQRALNFLWSWDNVLAVSRWQTRVNILQVIETDGRKVCIISRQSGDRIVREHEPDKEAQETVWHEDRGKQKHKEKLWVSTTFMSLFAKNNDLSRRKAPTTTP